jgi:hypothetical protein
LKEVKMIDRMARAMGSRQKRRSLTSLRKEFASCGYHLDHVDDAKIEAELKRSGHSIVSPSLGAKSIFLMARRLSKRGKSTSRGGRSGRDGG